MVEPEVAFNDSDDNMRLQEEFVSYIVARALERRQEELKELERDTAPLGAGPRRFPAFRYTDAVARLNSAGRPTSRGAATSAAMTRRCWPRSSTGRSSCTTIPRQVKAFYMKENPDDPRTVLNNDCLAPEGYGEIIGGSPARGRSTTSCWPASRSRDSTPRSYRWYLDLRKYGTFVHSGFGLGVERTVAWICGIPHIREAIAFPRQIHRLYP